jgi:UDP-3-O-[3-hydroxymyristoyl] glucosamine N-acyltransferase
MKFTASQIAAILDGEIDGNPDVWVDKLSKIEEGEQGSLTFLSNPKYTSFIYSTDSSIAIVDKDFIAEKEITPTLIRVSDAYGAFSKLLSYYDSIKTVKTGIESPSFVSEDLAHGTDFYLGAFSYVEKGVKVGDQVKIHPSVYIGENVTIGDNVTIFSGVKIYSDTLIGSDCVIHSNAVIGADGFGFAPNSNGKYDKVPQTGNVIIEDHVDIGAATTIDKATLGSTIIRKGVKLDNQIQIAHNVEIGENTVIAAQSGVAGSTKIGKNCIIGGQVGIGGHLTIGNNVRMQGQSGVLKNLKDDAVVQGTPAFNYSDFNKSYVYFKNLPKHLNQKNNK